MNGFTSNAGSPDEGVGVPVNSRNGDVDWLKLVANAGLLLKGLHVAPGEGAFFLISS